MPRSDDSIQIVPAALTYLESYRACVDSVARERKWLAIVEAFPLEETREFISNNIRKDNAAFFALDGNRVVGWADLRGGDALHARHRRELGMGVHADYRHRGIGTRLLQAIIEKAKAAGVMRLELGVYSRNPAAVALYRKLGFVEEGRLIKGRYVDGQFDDVIKMAMIFEENLPAST